MFVALIRGPFGIAVPSASPSSWPSTLASLLLLPALAAADGYESPSPSTLHSIQAQHGRKDWWFITTDSTRFLVRIRAIDPQGLSGLKPKRASEHAPNAIGWPSIARIDERHSKFLAKSIQGGLYGALIGGTLPFMIDQTNGGDYAGATLLAGAVVGTWLGGRWGDRIAREDPIYVSRTLIAPEPALPAPRLAEGVDSTRAAGPRVPGSGAAAIAEACSRIRPADRLRIHADFGVFDGQAELASADGLSGLRPHASHGGAEPIPGLVTWDRIQRIDRAGTAAVSGARRGAVVFGALGALTGLFAIAAVTAAGTSSADPGGSWILIGAAGGAAGGALIGAAIGSGGTSWQRIYVRE